jgi:aspartate-semialdehyde dehydrogenase
MRHVGIVGWRGMVGSVLLERMRAEADFKHCEPHFFSTSQAGQMGPDVGHGTAPLDDASDLTRLKQMDCIISCQGGDYTKQVHPELRRSGYKGYWIDAASALRMAADATIILDPVNQRQIDKSLDNGGVDFIGGNCTVSLMLMAMAPLLDQGWVEWINAATYQAASGAGARHMRELVAQMRFLGNGARELLDDPKSASLDIDRTVSDALRSGKLPTENFTAPLAASLLPWIDVPVENGQSREEWKGHVETNKIMGLEPEVPVDGVCVRIGAMRSHSQALTIKLKKAVGLDEISDVIKGAHQWMHLVPNEKQQTLAELSPAHISGTLTVGVGRLRKLRMGDDYLSLFTVGDQLLWGAAEPLRRMLRILVERP